MTLTSTLAIYMYYLTSILQFHYIRPYYNTFYIYCPFSLTHSIIASCFGRSIRWSLISGLVLLIEKMHSSPLLLEEPIRMASILEPSKPVSISFCRSFFFISISCVMMCSANIVLCCNLISVIMRKQSTFGDPFVVLLFRLIVWYWWWCFWLLNAEEFGGSSWKMTVTDEMKDISTLTNGVQLIWGCAGFVNLVFF